MSGLLTPAGPVLIAYDGSDLSREAIAEAGALLRPGEEALVVTAWEPYDVGFVTPQSLELDAEQIDDVRRAAASVAAEGERHATAAGFRAHSAEIEGSPAWRVICDLADAHDARMIVIGSHGRRGITAALTGSVAASVVAHSKRTVLVTHHRP